MDNDISPLSAINLPPNIRTFAYDRNAVTIGIVHFGIGNFHRAHQAVYVEDLLESGEAHWGIAGISLRSSAMRDHLKAQDYLYTLATLGEKTEYRIIGAIKDVLVAPEDPQAIIDLLAEPAIRLVSSTITEKGYCLTSGVASFDHPELQAERTSLATPTTIYGFLARGIMQRRHNTCAPAKLTVMCCDNISGGGELLESGVRHLLQNHDAESLAWAQQNVSFVSSMVDRVCPATDDALRARVCRETQRRDAWPVSAEPFSQWIIEGDFAGQRPEFDRVGAVFVKELAQFERMKLGYLNAAHSMASTLGYLSCDGFVHESLARSNVLDFVRQALIRNVLPNVEVPEGYDGASYVEVVIQRFQNGNLPYANLQVGSDTSQKIQQRWFPTIDSALAKGADCSYLQFCLGAWVIFIETALRNDVLKDPKKLLFERVDTSETDRMADEYLAIADAAQFEFFRQPAIMAAVGQHAGSIRANGIEQALLEFMVAQK